MTESIGNWDYLPHDPQAFFGLEDSFDRKQLKRAYGKLIRQYNPETHPDEFKRIRRAYEDLERQLRYGRESRQQSKDSQWAQPNAPTVSEEKASSEPGPRDRQLEPDLGALSVVDAAVASPRKTFERLQEKEDLSPQDYYVGAILSDLLQPPDGVDRFLGWITRGLRKHPRNEALQTLVTKYFGEQVPLEDAPRLLQQFAKGLRNHSFYRLTEKLWVRWLRGCSFEAFTALLEKCEQHLVQTDPRQRDSFFLCILRVLIWKAPADWTGEQLERLEEDAGSWDPGMQEALDFLVNLHRYRVTPSPLKILPEGQCIDQLLMAYCDPDDLMSLPRLVNKANEIAMNAHGMRAAFPMDADEDQMPLLLSMLTAFTDAGNTLGLEYAEGNEGRNEQQALAMVNDLRRTFSGLNNGLQWIGLRYKWFAFGVWLLLGACFGACVGAPLANFGNNGVIVIGLSVSLVLFIVAYFAFVYPRWLRDREMEAAERFVTRYYEKSWRERLFRYIQSCNEPIDLVMQRLEMHVRTEQDANDLYLVMRFARQDAGLTIFAMSQQFVV